MLSRFRPLCALLTLLATSAFAEGLSLIISYSSPLDNSIQQYGVYLPTSPAASFAGYPAILHAHGYGWSVGAGFSDFQKLWAEKQGWILINLNARGPQFYEGVGDVESRNVIRDANQRFGLDLARIFITGGSMGGTGAFRLAIRYPDVFAAAVGVDGWSDFREWHRHWYARADQPTDIEEFRRPLLEACSPLYWTGRARWGQVQASVSGRDSVVLPENGLSLYNALLERASKMPGAYESRLFLDYEAGHGGSTRLDQIYDFFARRTALAEPASFLCESTLLTHGNLYWGSLERLTVQGAFAALESDVNGGMVSVTTRNLTEFALHLQASPAAEQTSIVVWADGFPCYEGPPRTVHFQADLSPTGQLWGWHEHSPAGLRKTPALEGPLGEAFKVPFVVVYGTAGSPEETRRNQQEASDFARGWNNFMVHATAVVPIPEEQLGGPDLQSRSLVMFGTEGSSRLLQQANAVRELPVHVRCDRVIVRDPKGGDREYLGQQYGAFLCYPNPLTEFRTYLVICRGQWATKPDGSSRQGLEYDLEKLPWAYPDYVVFDTDQSELPHVLNVNDKPPVTCYEAGYFVEAGYFDQDWQPYRMATLDRVRALGLPVRRIRVASLATAEEGVTVAVAEAGGQPVRQARVTVRFEDTLPVVHSGVTDDNGKAFFRWPTPPAMTPPPCSVVNLMATGAAYDFTVDASNTTAEGGLGAIVTATPTDENGRARVTAQMTASQPATVSVSLLPPTGKAVPAVETLCLVPGQPRLLTFLWENDGLPTGEYAAELQVQGSRPRVSLSRPVTLRVGRWSDSPLRVTELKSADAVAESPWQVTMKLLNTGASVVTAEVVCAIIEARKYPPAQQVIVQPREELSVTFNAAPGEPPLPVGVYTVRVCVPGHLGATGTADFSIK